MMKLISKFALLVTILAILYFLISGNLFSTSPFVIAGQLLAVALSIWARRSFKAGQFSIHPEPVAGMLLSSGPYRFIRHPMYAAVLLLIWSSILGHLSIINVVIGLIVTGTVTIRIMTEEHFLQAHYPDYSEYSRKTKRIIPFMI
ncbi:MAG: isoprenylcysteine carboxylmethyltransferase family protein [Anaerolineae bacterium]|nr:isoprenylcysteine carboxylmethyltransferase family protein [Anaerolineae bacterium]